MKFFRLTEFAKSLTVEPVPVRTGWDLMRHIDDLYRSLPAPADFQFRMSRVTWDSLCDMNNLHGRVPLPGDAVFGVPVRIWPHVPDGEVWKVSRELLRSLGEEV